MINLRHHYVFAVLRPLLSAYLRLSLNYRGLPAPPLPAGRPALILANHNCAWDPFFVSFSFRRAIHFVASDHIFRLGWISQIIRYLVAPIPIVKSQIDLKAQRAIRQIIQDGGIVGLFPEGNRSFAGRTGWIFPSTGKLVKQLKCTLILYQIHGGYLATPRWSRYPRHGLITGQAVRVVEPAELAQLSPAAVNQLIVDYLAVDADAEQRTGSPIRFRGRRLAEYLERVLFVCPRCFGLATLHSRDDRLSCSCGIEVQYNEYGFLVPRDEWSREQERQGLLPTTVAAWDEWQQMTLAAWSGSSDGSIDWSGIRPIFTDRQERLYDCKRALRSDLLDDGQLALYADRLVWHGRTIQRVFPLSSLARLIVHGPQTLQFTTDDGNILEVRSRQPRSAYKYALLYQLLGLRRKDAPSAGAGPGAEANAEASSDADVNTGG